MGLAGTKVKQRFGLDPRNTNWSNDTSRFGHQYLEKMGWTQGKGLGLVDHATTTHVKVSIKDGNVGLGALLAKKQKKDEFDSGECAGLDVFQRILGRLNGKEDQINKELDRQKTEVWNGKWGMTFIKGEVLLSTWDAELAKKASKKRSRDDEKSAQESVADVKEPKRKKSKSNKEDDKKVKKDKKEKKESKDKKEKKEKKESKVKKERKESKDKKEKKESNDKKEKKEKKEAKDSKKLKKEKKIEKVTRESMLKPKESEAPQISTRLSVRSRWIKQKRASVMDAKALNEIFMITN